MTSVDADVFSNISYALEGDDSMSFAINPKSGIVKTVTEIDREFVCVLIFFALFLGYFILVINC